jgi:hypothetical protein
MNSISGESSGVTTVQYFDLFKIDNPIYFWKFYLWIFLWLWKNSTW